MISNSLSMACRPYMQFDVENIEHRRYASEFLKTMSWKNSSLNLYHYFQKKLLEYYMKTDVEISDVKVENQRVFKFRK